MDAGHAAAVACASNPDSSSMERSNGHLSGTETSLHPGSVGQLLPIDRRLPRCSTVSLQTELACPKLVVFSGGTAFNGVAGVTYGVAPHVQDYPSSCSLLRAFVNSNCTAAWQQSAAQSRATCTLPHDLRRASLHTPALSSAAVASWQWVSSPRPKSVTALF